ncbi:MAG: hypothetical protein OFPI_09700 [Osedax symbiont Rs2]|nr:MAG: hypothetical protein OFPI_09700 [Osedax symbiont Rs2]
MKRKNIHSFVFLGGLLSTLFSLTSTANVEISSTLQTEIGITDKSTLQKVESVWQPEFNISISDSLDMTFIGRLRFDTQKNLGYKGDSFDAYGTLNGPVYEANNTDFEIRELYFDTQMADVFWRLGKQQVVWGQADGLKILDVINPQNYREFILDDFDDSRIPLWMMNAEIPIGDDDSLQLLWILDQSYHRFANNGSDYQVTSPLLVPQPVAGIDIASFKLDKPNNIFKDSDLGLRYSKFYNGWDLTFNYLYHYLDSPVYYQQLSNNSVAIDAKYKRSHLFGLTASKAFDNWTVRSEIGYSTQSYHLLDNDSQAFIDYEGIGNSKDLSSVIGLDWQGLEDGMLSFQWFQSRLLDYDTDIGRAMIRPRNNQIYSALYQQNFANETWKLEALAMYGVDQNDSSIQVELSHMLESNLKIWVGADLFKGNKQSLFGQFNDTDRLVLGFEWGL